MVDCKQQTQKREQISLERGRRVSNERATIIWQFIFSLQIFRFIGMWRRVFNYLISFILGFIFLDYDSRAAIHLITFRSSFRSSFASIRARRPKTLDFSIPVARSESVCFQISYFFPLKFVYLATKKKWRSSVIWILLLLFKFSMDCIHTDTAFHSFSLKTKIFIFHHLWTMNAVAFVCAYLCTLFVSRVSRTLMHVFVYRRIILYCR